MSKDRSNGAESMKVLRAIEVSLPFVSVCLGIVCLEIFSWVVLHASMSTNETAQTSPPKTSKNNREDGIKDLFSLKTHKEFRLARPAPYQGSEYFPWFIKEEWSNLHPECKSNIVHDGEGYSLKESDTPFCRGYTRINGKRITTDVPERVRNRIWIFGGSTVQNHEVPNRYTVASYLQRMVNEKLSVKRFGVENRGFSSVTVNQQNDLLRKENIKKGDIVVFFDGINNQFQGVANNSPHGNIIKSNKQNVLLARLKENLAALNTAKLMNRVLVGRRREGKEREECIVPSKPTLTQRAEVSFSYYLGDLSRANWLATNSGARFIHFMQPHLFSDNSVYSEYEKSLIDTMPSQMVPCGAKIYMSTASSVYRKRHKEIAHKGIESYDLGSLFAQRSGREEIFLDLMQVTDEGNRMIAEAILERLSSE